MVMLFRLAARPVVLVALVLWGMVLALAGCASAVTRIGPELSGAVVTYCAAVPAVERAALRAAVNSQIAPHRVSIDCANDAPDGVEGG